MKKKSGKKQVLIVMGPPGAGKGTQAGLLAEKFDLYYIETAKIIEARVMEARRGDYVTVEGKRYSLLQQKKFWQTGILCDPPLVSYWMKNKIKELAKEGKGIVMAGSPRTLPEGKDLMPFVKKLYGPRNIKIILIDISAEESIWRNSHRRICELMRHPILYTKETVNLKRCPFDGSKLLRRKGLDDPATIRIRLKEYKERTLPLLDFLKKEGLKIKKIDGSPPPVEVFQGILRALK